MEPVSLKELADYCGAIVAEKDAGIIVTSVCKDTREIIPGCLFVAFAGTNADGHDFIGNAAGLGAAAALVSKEDDYTLPVLRAENTLTALQDIAKGYRGRFNNIRAVGVTGSAGKTTTKEMLAAVLGAKYNTLKTKGNYNNEIGLPLTVLNLEKTHEAAVFEMGMNHFGEISGITKIAQPDTAVITNIGVMHIEHLGSREGILKAKLEILDGLKPGGTAILNGDEPLLWEQRDKLPCKTIYFGMKNRRCDVFVSEVCEDISALSLKIRTPAGHAVYKIPMTGLHNAMNAACAAACAEHYGITPEYISAGFEKLKDFALRQKIYEKNGIVIIDDTYNAGPDSMAAALSVLAGMKIRGRKIAVLGSMLELGAYSREAHYDLGKLAAKHADLLFLYGDDTKYCAEGAHDSGMSGEYIRLFDSREKTAAVLETTLKSGDAVLFKGSRGMKMEKILELAIK